MNARRGADSTPSIAPTADTLLILASGTFVPARLFCPSAGDPHRTADHAEKQGKTTDEVLRSVASFEGMPASKRSPDVVAPRATGDGTRT